MTEPTLHQQLNWLEAKMQEHQAEARWHESQARYYEILKAKIQDLEMARE